MTLVSLIRKRERATLANANPAKAANYGWAPGGTLARLATLALANPTEENPAKTGAGDTATAYRWWLIHYPDCDPVEVAYCPEVTHAEILERHPGAVATEPFTPSIRQPSAPLSAEEETAIRAWLALIEETDPATITEVIGHCQRDADVRDFVTGRAAAELPKLDPCPDNRRTCDQCANLIGRRCQAARRGEIVANRDYEPSRDLPRRCEGYAPGPDDPDRRHGRERWPGLIQKGGK